MSDCSGCDHKTLVRSSRVPTPRECEQCGKLEVLILRSRAASWVDEKSGLLNIIKDLQDRIADLTAKLKEAEAEKERYRQMAEHHFSPAETDRDTCNRCSLNFRDPVHTRG